MPRHEIKTCPCCHRPFECKVGNIAECQCGTVQLTYAERAFIEEKHFDCLCAECLKRLRAEYRLGTVNGEL